ncbi:cation transporter [Paroceanicella profunda]|uniref:Cation transporter n=1 Tax=Paroceanicella profunda TaxID=2579971 RepID=A0A5B8FYY5_9RHOB|nr:cation diffusion facilitator family transporter [Paroceanicella profunda]QDL92874.1 cation transporter [Paroceanicella profunda]
MTQDTPNPPHHDPAARASAGRGPQAPQAHGSGHDHGRHDAPGHSHGGGHAHSHGHHHHIDPDAGDRRVILAIAVNVALTLVQIIGGVVSGSLALIADAIHNLSDAVSLVIALVARRVAKRPSDAQMTFGYRRAEVVAALVNYTTLVVIGVWLAAEAVQRFFDPQPVEGWTVVWIAGVALVIDVITALLTYAMAKDSMNIRAAFVHNVADALGSVAVIVAGTLILLYGWNLADPIITLMISAYILWHAGVETGPVIRILMLGSPPQIASEDVLETMCAVAGVGSVHHLHLWQVDETRSSVDAHVVIAEGAWSEADVIKEALRAALSDRFGITHSTLELECSRHGCVDPQVIGHRDAAA